MHPKEQYEEIITGKLAALPLPDMADAIWARIEQQLDIDMPTDGGDVPEPPSPQGGGGIVVGGGFLAAVGAILVFLFLQKPHKTIPSSTIKPQSTIEQPVINNAVSKPPGDEASAPRNTVQLNTSKITPAAPIVDSVQRDVATASQLPPADTSAAVPNLTAQTELDPPPVVKQDSLPKKRRGVQGISDKDYRIVPKKDEEP